MTGQKLKGEVVGSLALAGVLNGCESRADYHRDIERSKYEAIPTVRGAPVPDYIGLFQLN